MDKQNQIREELDEWLAEGRIDRATYDRLLDEQLGEPSDSVSGSLMTGAAGITMGMAVAYLILLQVGEDPVTTYRVSLAFAWLLGVVGTWLVRGMGWNELGRSVAIVASTLWSQAVLVWLGSDFPPDGFYISTVFAILAAGHWGLAYMSTSAVVLMKACLWAVLALLLYLLEWDDGRYQFGDFVSAFAGLGAIYLVLAREHLVLRWPTRDLAIRFAMTYHLAGLTLINWVAYSLAWFGWDGEGHADVGARLLCVTVTVVLYGLEVWAGQHSRMPWVTAMGVIHFLLQVVAILSYDYISLQQRALLVIGFALLLILIAQGESSSRRSSRP